jgi:hypothetical protein
LLSIGNDLTYTSKLFAQHFVSLIALPWSIAFDVPNVFWKADAKKGLIFAVSKRF